MPALLAGHSAWARSARSTFSAVIGRSVIRTPTASYTALAIAPAVGTFPLSPIALPWSGRGAFVRGH